MKRMAFIYSGMILLVGIFVFTAGCESAKGTASLTVSPPEVNLVDGSGTNGSYTVTFTVVEGLRELSLPLEWHVSNPSVGRIVASAGVSASYQATTRTKDGSLINTVIVKDQYDAEGLVTVRQ